MNQTIETILNRRSVRVYSEEQIKQEDLDLIIQTGLFSPSACNTQPWHFTVVQNQKLLEDINVQTKKEMLKCNNEYFQNMGANEKYTIFYNAPTVIFISGEKAAIAPQTDCAAAIENMLLAAESLNIGTCWIGLVKYLLMSEKGAEYIKKLNIPEGYETYYAITLGYKKIQNPKPQPRRENTVSYIK